MKMLILYIVLASIGIEVTLIELGRIGYDHGYDKGLEDGIRMTREVVEEVTE